MWLERSMKRQRVVFAAGSAAFAAAAPRWDQDSTCRSWTRGVRRLEVQERQLVFVRSGTGVWEVVIFGDSKFSDGRAIGELKKYAANERARAT
jgi:hypothetical protein